MANKFTRAMGRVSTIGKEQVGIDMNSLTSAALTKYSAQLKKDIAALESKKSGGTITSTEEKELKSKQASYRAASMTHAKLLKFAAELKGQGVTLGDLTNESVYSIGEKADQQNPGDAIITRIINKYAGKTYLSGMSGAKTAVVDSLKVTAGVTLAVAGFNIAQDIAKSVGSIGLEGVTVAGESVNNVGDAVNKWLDTNAPHLKGAIWTILITSAVLVAVKKYQNFEQTKNATLSEADAAQQEATKEQIEAESKTPKKSLNDQITRAQVDPSYLSSIQEIYHNNAGGKTIDQIIADGPATTEPTLYNACLILQGVDKASKPKAKSTDEINFDNEVAKYLSGVGKNRDDLYNQIYAVDPNNPSAGLISKADRDSLQDIVNNAPGTKGKYTANQVYAARILMAVEAKEKAYGSES